jgi:hypothetical protein
VLFLEGFEFVIIDRCVRIADPNTAFPESCGSGFQGSESVVRIRIGSRFHQVSGSDSESGFGIRIGIQEGKNATQKQKKKGKKILYFRSPGCSLLVAESFS